VLEVPSKADEETITTIVINSEAYKKFALDKGKSMQRIILPPGSDVINVVLNS
jgi:hypothetical protein